MITLRLFGSVDLAGDGGRQFDALLRQPKRMAVLAYLAAATPRGFHRRDRLLALFWPERSDDRARHALSQSLHVLRRELGGDAILTRGEGEIALNGTVVGSDVVAFEEAVEHGELLAALELYRGDFLAGLFVSEAPEFERWVERERDRLARAQRTVLEQLAERAAQAGDRLGAVSWWRRVSEQDPYSTRVALRVMEALEVAGDRAGALHHADRHAARLREDLEAEPSPDVAALAGRLRAEPVSHDPAAERLERLRAALAGRYAIQREVGHGSMATVYLADDVRHNRKVAVKVLRPEVAAVLGGRRFLNEIKVTANLQHPHILPLFDSGDADGLLYYVMPYVEGESLRDRLNREKQLPVEDALQIAREVADALGSAHRHDVIHRDIKPENILLEERHAVVTDFGIARAIHAAGGKQLTDTGLPSGTPAYLSPEQAMGSKVLDGRSDLYSLGCVLYEMLGGKPPFTGATVERIVHQQIGVEPRPVTELRPAVPAEVVAALSRVLSKAPTDRFGSAARFARALAKRESAAVVPTPMLATRPTLRSWRRLTRFGMALVAVVGAVWIVGRWARPTPAGEPAHPRTAIAVLPFQDLTAEESRAYFASGLHNELLTQLAKVAGLKVIARTSVLGYAGTTKPITEIAGELAVGSIVGGSVQVEGNRLRVNVWLIDATADVHLWAERYDRTIDDAFATQSEVGQQIVAAVGAALSVAEEQRLIAVPTANPEAFRLYLQGREYDTRPGYLRQNLEIAQQFYERALKLDPEFALAHAALSQVHGLMYWVRYDPSPARAARQQEEAEAAVRVAPELPEAHVAMGVAHYLGRREYRQALQEFRIALEGLPNDAVLWMWIGWVHRRLGNWDEVLGAFDHATQLDPRNANLFVSIGGDTYQNMHRYGEAVRAYDQALSLAPDNHVAAVRKGQTYVLWQGQTDTLRSVLSRLPTDAEMVDIGTIKAQHVQLLHWEREADSLLQLLAAAHESFFEAQDFFLPASLYAAWAHRVRGDTSAARATFDSACLLLDSVVAELPHDWRVHAARGLALAGLGRRDEALSEAQWLQQSVVYRRDARHGALAAEYRARILAQAGEPDAALDEIERLLTTPSWLSVHTLRLDPLWDPLREHSRFQALLTKHES